MKRVAFLDRDGVINTEIGYLSSVSNFNYCTNVIEGLKKLASLGFEFIIITNQSGIARGYYTLTDFHKLMNWLVEDLHSNGVHILDYKYCPHHPDGVVSEFSVICECRKPLGSLIVEASQEFNINLSESILVGDKVSDIAAGINAGIPNNYLVRTGHVIPSEYENSLSTFDDLLSLAYSLS